ncbi:MAG: GntR family transcriptional regulator [Mesorhizobium sp.]
MDQTAFAYRPLYAQVRDQLVRRLIDGEWQPGQLIPSEIELAREIGVSQGTIRKALDAMTTEHLLIRRQGRGTFVARPEESRILFQFFRLVPDDGAPRFPDSAILDRQRGAATALEAEALALAPGDPVWRIERVRTLAGAPLLVETITLPAARLSGFGELAAIPNNVYGLYSERWGITIGRASERLKAVAASTADAEALGCAPGTPLLSITRIAFDLENKPVELRVSRCLTEAVHYSSELG